MDIYKYEEEYKQGNFDDLSKLVQGYFPELIRLKNKHLGLVYIH